MTFQKRTAAGTLLEFVEAHWLEPLQEDGTRTIEATVLFDGEPYTHVICLPKDVYDDIDPLVMKAITERYIPRTDDGDHRRKRL